METLTDIDRQAAAEAAAAARGWVLEHGYVPVPDGSGGGVILGGWRMIGPTGTLVAGEWSRLGAFGLTLDVIERILAGTHEYVPPDPVARLHTRGPRFPAELAEQDEAEAAVNIVVSS